MKSFSEAKILDVNLTTQSYQVRTLSGEVYKKYPGGSALGMYLMLQEMKPNTEPFSPENLLIFSVSPLTGLPISGQSRMTVTTKSPLTGGAGDSQAGGYMPIHIKGNGYDSILFRGKAEKPIYIYIDGDKVEFKDGQNVWGKITGEAEQIIKEELGESKVEIAQIGPAGENLVKFASIMNMSNRANGRNGVGAVMGSKNLKALVVKKKTSKKPVVPEKFKELVSNIKDRIKENETITALGEHGTDVDLKYFNEDGFCITRNWREGFFPEGAEKITGETMTDTVLVGRETCYACAIRCKRMVEIPGKVDPFYGGPEYETSATFGSYCGVSDFEDVCMANQLCNMYGMDTISCGATVAFAMECYENGLLTKEDTDQIDLRFGNGKAYEALLPKIAKREQGIGNLLAEGSMRAAQLIGKGAEQYSMSVKNQEMPAHMPQMKQSLSIVYAVNPFGADHQSSEHDVFLMLPADSQEKKRLAVLGIEGNYDSYDILDDGKIDLAFNSQKFFSLMDTLCLCQFAWGPSWELYGPDELISLCKYGIGWETSIEELMKIGERRINMMRYFNAREGFTKEDDKLPKRIFEPLEKGPAKGAKVDEKAFIKGREKYYQLAGWNVETGNPTGDTLNSLGLDWLVE